MVGQISFVRSFDQLSASDSIIAGGKGSSLGELIKAKIPVPSGFVILGAAFDKFLESAGLSDYNDLNIQQNIISAEMPKDIADQILLGFRRLGAKRVAVRSSATAEDSSTAAWAGQLETYLNTNEENLLENVKKCWASLFLPRALAYRDEKGFNDRRISVAVVVQKMVESEKAGIAFSVHPITQDPNQMIIEAVFGLGEVIVSGAANPDGYVVEKRQRCIVDRQVRGQNSVLPDKEILYLADLLIKIEKHYGFPVDIEWAQEKGKFYIVQSRPITTLGKNVPRQIRDVLYIKDLIQKYQKDQICFDYPCLVLYACLTWYWETTQAKEYFGTTLPYFFFYIKGGAGVLEAPWYLGPGEKVMGELKREKERWINNNNRQCDRAEKGYFKWLENNPVKQGRPLEEYLKLLKNTVKELLDNQIHFQISTQIDKPLNQEIIQSFQKTGGLLSKEEIFNLSVSNRETEAVMHDQALSGLRVWCRKNNLKMEANGFEANIRNRDFMRKLQACYDIGYFLRSGYGGVVLWSLEDEYGLLITDNERRENNSKNNIQNDNSLSNEQIFWLSAARYFSAGRDRRKAMQQRAFYRMAEILEEVGKIINISRADLECLRIEEFTEGFLTGQSVKQLIAARRNGYLGFWSPETGTWEWSGEEAEKAYQRLSEKYQSRQELKGNCACPGWAKGRVRIVLNPRLQENFEEGEVLVAGMTSPDYVPLMKKAAAVITELGGITCHAAIISRELNVPCIIGTNIATKVLKDGELVEVDATNGIVKIFN